jgi:hypothetical protein
MDRASFMRPTFEMPVHDVHGKGLANHKSHHRPTRPLRNWSKPKQIISPAIYQSNSKIQGGRKMDRASLMSPPLEMPTLDVHRKVLAKHISHHRLTRPLRNWSKLK